MDFSEKWGTDVDTAVQLALADLKCTIDEVEVTVLEEPSRGFFGIGSKLALVRVEKKKQVEEPPKKEEAPAPRPKKAEPVVAQTPVPASEPAQDAGEQAAACESVEKAEESEEPKAAEQQSRGTRRNDRRDRNRGRGRKREFKAYNELPQEPVIARVPDEELSPCEDHAALRFLKEVVGEMGLDLDITAKIGGDVLYIDIQGKDSGTIIGKRGQTLDAIQYLTSLVVNKENEDYIRVIVDAENYRAKRELTLEKLAIRLANKVAKTGRSVKLEPMNPYERKVIHATLQSHPYVTTKSEGQDPYRRVVILTK